MFHVNGVQKPYELLDIIENIGVAEEIRREFDKEWPYEEAPGWTLVMPFLNIKEID